VTQDIYAGLMPRQAGPAGPKYRQIAEDLRTQIKSGEYPPGSRLPTKAELMAEYHVAVNTVERAIEELRQAGIVETAQGAGMFVREPPPGGTPSSTDTDGRLRELESEVASLRKEFGLLQAQVMNLYHSTGQPYPYEDSTEEQGRQVG
jgi:DNA-binding GntR family transcriptional regulator